MKQSPTSSRIGVGAAFEDEPALAGEHGVALDSLMLREINGHISRHHEAAGDQDLRLQQGENLG
jgi:hypothetical protein